jgi:hypothetical protein
MKPSQIPTSGIDNLTFPLTSIRLRFHCVAETSLRLGGLRAGSNLRGALLNVMRRATCTGSPADPAHLAVCPVCWLAAANDHPGQERRGYVITPPLNTPEFLERGAGFDFHITLFGNASRYLPYFVLAVPEAGRSGVGVGRGQFSLESISAEHPLSGDWPVLKAGEHTVRPPSEWICHSDIEIAAANLLAGLDIEQGRLRMDFPTPLRLIVNDRLLKSPDFGALFNHILRRLDEIVVQYAGGSERPVADRQRLWELANRVRLIESQITWADVPSGSSRTGQQTWISGMVGSAWYSAPSDVWREIMPWLVWGQIAQVGKDTSKGNGVYQLHLQKEGG